MSYKIKFYYLQNAVIHVYYLQREMHNPGQVIPPGGIYLLSGLTFLTLCLSGLDLAMAI